MPGAPDAARLMLPRAALSGSVFIAVERDTRGLALRPTERLNWYPATPMASISWVFEGSLHLVASDRIDRAPSSAPALPRLMISGPHRGPSISWSPGGVHALTVAFLPHALASWLTVPFERLVDQTWALHEAVTDSFCQDCNALFTLAPGLAPFDALQDRLAAAGTGPGHVSGAPWLRRWLATLATRAAFSPAGSSVRQAQRRFKHWTGQSRRDLERYVRAQDALRRTPPDGLTPPAGLADVAADAGYADQSHMGREVKRLTGWSPARLRALMAHDEAFWFYRLLAGELRDSA